LSIEDIQERKLKLPFGAVRSSIFHARRFSIRIAVWLALK